jgi:hypothetical protein
MTAPSILPRDGDESEMETDAAIIRRHLGPMATKLWSVKQLVALAEELVRSRTERRRENRRGRVDEMAEEAVNAWPKRVRRLDALRAYRKKNRDADEALHSKIMGAIKLVPKQYSGWKRTPEFANWLAREQFNDVVAVDDGINARWENETSGEVAL